MKTPALLFAALALVTLASPPAPAAESAVCGKDGQTLPVRDLTGQAAGSPLLADVEYSTAGALDTPATTGGASDGWGSHLITGWVNTTGQDVTLAELGWPASGPGPVAWAIWISETLPATPGNPTFGGLWIPAVGDPDEFPPSTYAYVDISAETIVIPAGANFFFGYENPGLGGQIDFNGVETYAWYADAWDPDSGWGRTTLLQFKGNHVTVPTTHRTLGQIKSLFR